ncbi:MAG: hypothetical protein WCJ56_09045 [bacterium]
MFEFSSLPVQLQILAFIVFFICIWCLVSLVLSLISGWYRMAKIFRSVRKPEGKYFRWQSGIIWYVNYNNVLNIHVSEEGIFISLIWLFSFGSPPLFIPWNDIYNLHEEQFLWMRYAVFTVGDPALTTIKLPVAVFEGRE